MVQTVTFIMFLRLVRSNSALVTDAYGRRYRAFYNAAQRER